MRPPIRRASAVLAGVVLSAAVHGQTTISDSVRSFTSLTNTTVTLTGKSELHITGTNNPVAGSTIHLDSHDSWLFFDNIRPNTVNSSHLGQVRVNGAPAAHGTNVRVVQFGMGTVVTPFTNAEQPLETFTDPGFLGGSKLHNLYTYYNTGASLGVMNANISSFKLKRGFMATFATQPDGTGASKIYIAQDHDVNIGAMPSNLDNAVRFVRVFPWRWVSKKGSCDVSADALDAAWYYNWNNNTDSTLNWEYVPIRQQRWWPGYPANKPNVTHLSGFNEPDNPIEDSYQTLGNGSRDAAVAAWPELLATGLRVGSPATTDAGKWWLYEFMDKANAAGRRVDYITLHFYRCGQSAAQLKSWMQEVWDRYQKPIWLTEFNNGADWTTCGDPSTEQNASVIGSWIDMMDSTPWVERYAVYSNVEWQRNMTWNASWSGGSGLTPAGVVYRDQKSPVGYQQETYPLAVRRGIARLPMEGDTKDGSGHGNGAVSYGAPAFTTGQTGQAVELDGSNRYLRLPPGVADSSSFTFAAWVRWDGGSANQRIFDFGNGTDQYLFLSPSAGGSMRFGLRNNNGTTNSITTATLPSGSWQHVAVTMQGSFARIYLNGALQAQGTVAGNALSGTSRNYIGKSQWSTDPLFDGAIDEVVLIDSALDETRIAELMTGISSPFTAHWSGDVDAAWNTNNAGDTNWSVDAAHTADTGLAPGGFTEVNFSNGPAATTLGGDFSVDSLVITTPDAVTIGGSHDLAVGPKGIYSGNTAGAAEISTGGRVRVDADQSWVNNSANDLTVSGIVAGAAKLTVSGGGRVVLTGANENTGDLAIVGGGAVGTPSIGTSLSSPARILMGGSGSTGALVYTGVGEVSNRVLTFQGGYGSPGIVLDQSGTGTLELTAALESIAQVSKTLTLRGSTGGEGLFSGVIANAGTTTAVTKTGTGTWTLSGANTYSGTTRLEQGTLAIGNNAALGSGTLDLWGGAIRSSDATARTIANAVTLSADTTFGGTGDLVFTGAVSAGTFPKTFIVENALTTFSGVISGSGPRAKAGPGTLLLSGANTYTGPTIVSAGTLRVDGSLAAASAVTVESGGRVTGSGQIKGPVAFSSGGGLSWSLGQNVETAGKLTTGAVTVSSGAVVDLVFNAPGSTVDFSDPFWTSIHTWPVLTSGGLSGLFTLGSVSNDPAGRPLADYGTFHLQQSPQGVSIFFAPVGLVPPDPPAGFTATAGHRGVSLSWEESVGTAAYLVYRSTHPGGPYETIATVVSGTTFRDESVVDGTTYYYVVSASNPNGISDPALEVMATPHAPSVIEKADNPLDLTDAGSWSGGIVPTGLDTARWSGSAGGSVLLGGGSEWRRVEIAGTADPVNIGGPGVLTLGTGGLGMESAANDLSVSSDLTLAAGHQVWNIAAGRGAALDGGTFARATGATWNVRGGGVVSADMTGLANDGSDDLTSGGGMLGPWATTGEGTAVAYSALTGGAVAAFTGATSAGAFGWASGNPAGANYDVAAVQGALGISRAAHTVRYTGSAGTQTWGNSSANVTITLDGILNAGTGTLTFAKGGTGTGTGLVIGAGRELVLHAANAGIAITAPVFDNPAGASSLTVAGTAGVTLGGANGYTGSTTIGSGALTVSGSGTLGAGEVLVDSAAELQLHRSLTVSQTVKGGGSITGTATTTLTGDFSGFTGTYTHNSTTNSTVVNQTVSLSRRAAYHIASAHGSQQGLLTNVTSGSPVFDLGSLSGVANSLLRNGGSVTGNTTVRVGHLGTDTTFAGTFGGGGGTLALTKVGRGTLVLSGAGVHTGPTRVEGGNLRLTGSFTGNSAVEVLAGAQLSGTGSANGAVSIASGGVLSPGTDTGGVLTLSGGLNLADGAVIEVGIGTTSGSLALGGEPVSAGQTTLRITALDGFGTGTYPLMTGAGAVNPAAFVIGDAPPGYQYLLGTSGGTLSLTIAVPPAAPAGLAASATSWNVSLAWEASPGTSHYQVKRAAGGAGESEVIATVFGTQYTDTGAGDGVLYTYTVTAWNAAGESAPSDGAQAMLATQIAAWRLVHFGSTDDSGDAADLSDFDRDGLCNLVEYALGTDPKSPHATAAPHSTGSAERLTIGFTRNAYALDVVLSVWGADNPAGAWEELARSEGGAPFTDVVADGASGAPVQETGTGATRAVEVGDIVPLGDEAHPKRFLRVKVVR